jgi:amino acid transporter
MADAESVVIEHPNRRKASSQLARLAVIALLLASALVGLIVALGGWDALEGAKPVQIVFIVAYFVLALFVARWSRGVLPLIAALAIILAIFGAVAAPAWFDRDKAGFTDPALSADLLGFLCVLLVALQLALLVAAMIGFRQHWNVEAERPRGEERHREPAAA